MVRRDDESGRRRRNSRDNLTSRPEVESLLHAASAPASTRELAGELAAVDAFHRARLVTFHPPGDEMTVSRSARTGLKAAFAAAAAVALLSTGVAFAASGHAPWSASPAAAGASTHAVDPTHPTHPSDSDDPSDDPSDGPTDVSGSTGPNVHALGGLCRAYMSGNKSEHGRALQSQAFTALVAAAGGSDGVEAFCATVSHGPSAHPTHPAKPSQAASPTRPTHPAKPTEAATPTHPASKAVIPTHPAAPSHPSGG